MRENVPDGFPPLTLLVMRALCALTLLYPGNEEQEKLTKVLDVLYYEYWCEHKKTNEKEVLAEILTRVLGEGDSRRGM
jgi:2-hydroxychromene-2-carboxylate isomerase